MLPALIKYEYLSLKEGKGDEIESKQSNDEVIQSAGFRRA